LHELQKAPPARGPCCPTRECPSSGHQIVLLVQYLQRGRNRETVRAGDLGIAGESESAARSRRAIGGAMPLNFLRPAPESFFPPVIRRPVFSLYHSVLVRVLATAIELAETWGQAGRVAEHRRPLGGSDGDGSGCNG
jgi:hypothetical protein